MLWRLQCYTPFFRKQSIRLPHNSQINEFREALESCQLEDLGYKGYPFTWTNKRPSDANTKLRFNRVVVMKGWIEKFQVSNVVHLLPHASNHLPIAIQKNSGRNIVELNEVLSLKNVGCCGMIMRLGFSKHGVWQEVGLRVWQMCMQKLGPVVMN